MYKIPYLLKGGEKIYLTRPTIEEPKTWMDKPTTRVRRGKETAMTYVQLEDDDPEVLKQKLKHYIGSSKKGVGILGVGDGVLDAMTDWSNDKPLVKTPADLYRLTLDDLVDLPIGKNKAGGDIRLGERRARDLLVQIERSRTMDVSVFLGSLGIDLLGRRRVKLLAGACGLVSLDDWLDEDKLAKIPGDTIRSSIIEGLRNSRPLIDDLLSVGVRVSPLASVELSVDDDADGDDVVDSAVEAKEEAKPVKKRLLEGVSMCFTGTRDLLERAEAEGAVIKTGISRNLDILVQKSATSNSNKTQKAEELGVKIISVDRLRQILNGEVTIEEILRK